MGGELTCKVDRPALPERHEGGNPSQVRHQLASCHHLPIRQVSKRDLDSKPPVSLTRINREESYSGCESQRFLFTHLFSLHVACVSVCVGVCLCVTEGKGKVREYAHMCHMLMMTTLFDVKRSLNLFWGLSIKAKDGRWVWAAGAGQTQPKLRACWLRRPALQ